MTSSPKQLAKLSSNLVGMFLGWVSTKFAHMMWLIFLLHELIAKFVKDIFDFLAKTACQILFIHGGDIPWMGLVKSAHMVVLITLLH